MKTVPTLNKEEISRLVSGELDPFKFLGAHHLEKSNSLVAVRAFIPGARSVNILDLTPVDELPASLIDKAGLFEALIPDHTELRPYRLKVDFGAGGFSTFYDCYSFLPVIPEQDLYLFGQGNCLRIYDRLGAHPIMHQGVKGVLFSLWAPSAKRVSLIGDFNQWDGRRHRMRIRGQSGIWELFVPHLKPGLIYKYEILTPGKEILFKADPFAFGFEQRPKTASVVEDLEGFKWTDEKWMEGRSKKDHLASPMSVYEVHLGSWRRKEQEGDRWLTYGEDADELIPYVKDMGFNYIELLPIAEHPFDGSWGYQVTGYYAATSRFGAPEDLMAFIDRCHNEEIGVILDWVPAHFPRDPHGLEYFDGTHLFEHSDPRQGAHRDWDTLIFNYGRNEVRNFLVANALFWLEKYHIDGLRVDAVASMLYLDYSREKGDWVPNRYGGRENLEAIEFLKNLNTRIFEQFPGAITIAEESTAWPAVTAPVHLGGLGFLFKWNMGWMHDMLSFMRQDPVHRRYQMDKLTFSLLYAFSENFMLPLSHDEVVHGKASLLSKMPGDEWQKFANLRLLLGYMYGEPGKKTLFMGAEIGQWSEWNHDAQIEWGLLQFEPHRAVKKYVGDLNRCYMSEPALFEKDFDAGGFEWIDFRDTDSTVVSFIRKGDREDDFLAFVFNFTPVPRENYVIGVPEMAFYREIMNSDATCYGGSGSGNWGGIMADKIPSHGRQYSISLTLPPLGMLILKPVSAQG